MRRAGLWSATRSTRRRLGPLVSDAHRRTVRGHVERAISDGARLVHGDAAARMVWTPATGAGRWGLGK